MEKDDFKQKNDAFEQGRVAMVNTAKDEVNIERQRLLEEARKDADALREKLKAAVQLTHDSLNLEVVKRIQDEVFAITRQTLSDLATVNLEAQISDVFTDRLRALDNTAKAGLATALKTSSKPALVRSAFELPTKQCEAIQHVLKEAFSVEIPVKFETMPSLVCGIELSANGQKIAWSIDDYLASLNRRVKELLNERVERKP